MSKATMPKAMAGRVIVKALPQEKSHGGLHLPQHLKDGEGKAAPLSEVVSVGFLLSPEGSSGPLPNIEVGDRVLVLGGSSVPFRYQGEELIAVDFVNILAIVPKGVALH